jgi:hypothetical protein
LVNLHHHIQPQGIEPGLGNQTNYLQENACPHSLQDQILIEVWEKVEAVKAADPDPVETVSKTPGQISNFRQFARRQSSKRKKRVRSRLLDELKM